MTDRKVSDFRLFYLTGAFCLLAIFAISTSVHARGSISIEMCYEEQELVPFFMGTGPLPPEKHPGIFVEMMYLLRDSLPDINISLHRAPWKRCLNELKNNLSDVVIASYKKDREAFGVYPKTGDRVDASRSISSAQYCLFTKRNSKLTWNGIEFSQIPEKPLAVPQGYSIVSMLQRHELPLVFTNSSVAAMDLLSKSVASASVTYCDAGGNYLWKNADQNTGVIAQSPTLSQSNGYLLFSKDFYQNHPELVQTLWRNAVTIRNEQFPKLLDKYEALRFSRQTGRREPDL